MFFAQHKLYDSLFEFAFWIYSYQKVIYIAYNALDLNFFLRYYTKDLYIIRTHTRVHDVLLCKTERNYFGNVRRKTEDSMMKKRTLPIILIVLMALACMLTACNSDEIDVSGKTKVVFVLEGATYKNSDLPVTYYFGFENGTSNLIKDMFVSDTGYLLEYTGYEVEGWYRTKKENGAEVSYEDKWDFKTDKVTNDGVTLYAKWQPIIKYSYAIYYRKDDGTEQSIGDPYYVKKGDAFNDILDKAKNGLKGHTFLRFAQENGEDWDNSFKHPGGETDCEVKVYAEYIEGKWSIVNTFNELRLNKRNNIYLNSDIDLGGSEFSFGDYQGKFNGNGHTISNFKIAYDTSRAGLSADKKDPILLNCLYIGIFGNLKDAVIENVKFKNVSVEVKTVFTQIDKIYVSAVCAYMENSVINEVVVENFDMKVTQTPWDKDEEKKKDSLVIAEDGIFIDKDKESQVTNTSVNQVE